MSSFKRNILQIIFNKIFLYPSECNDDMIYSLITIVNNTLSNKIEYAQQQHIKMICKSLATDNIVNMEFLNQLFNRIDYSMLAILLNLFSINKLDIKINNKLLSVIDDNENIYLIIELIKLLSTINYHGTIIVNLFSVKKRKHLLYLHEILKRLKNNIFNLDILFIVNSIFNSITTNQERSIVSFKIINILYAIINMIDKSFNINEYTHFFIKVAESRRLEIYYFFYLLFKKHITVKNEIFIRIMNFSISNLFRLGKTIKTLNTHGVLCQQHFEIFFNLIANKLSPVKISSVTNDNNKFPPYNRCQFILNENIYFYANLFKSSFIVGSFGKVYKAYHTYDALNPTFGVKILNALSNPKASTDAKRETKYHRLLSRNAYYFVWAAQHIVLFDWQPGRALSEIKSDELITQPIGDRLKCALYILHQLNIFHTNYRLHGDIKAKNVIVDLLHLQMNLIDFGSSHKKGSQKKYCQTYQYIDSSISSDSFLQDIYAMGLVLMQLFPELFTFIFTVVDVKYSFIGNKKNPLHLAVYNLCNTMIRPIDEGFRCTIFNALQFCQGIIDNLGANNLSNKMQHIGSMTLFHQEKNVADILFETRDSSLLMPLK